MQVDFQLALVILVPRRKALVRLTRYSERLFIIGTVSNMDLNTKLRWKLRRSGCRASIITFGFAALAFTYKVWKQVFFTKLRCIQSCEHAN